MGGSPVIEVCMTFGKALKEVAAGKKIRRVEWLKDGTYLALDPKDQLSIFKTEDKKLHPLIVTSGDILGEDWVIIS
jgi:hypothetical protein